jgi:hypothetical protein
MNYKNPELFKKVKRLNSAISYAINKGEDATELIKELVEIKRKNKEERQKDTDTDKYRLSTDTDTDKYRLSTDTDTDKYRLSTDTDTDKYRLSTDTDTEIALIKKELAELKTSFLSLKGELISYLDNKLSSLQSSSILVSQPTSLKNKTKEENRSKRICKTIAFDKALYQRVEEKKYVITRLVTDALISFQKGEIVLDENNNSFSEVTKNNGLVKDVKLLPSSCEIYSTLPDKSKTKKINQLLSAQLDIYDK